MLDLNKTEIDVLANYLNRNLRHFRENNLEKKFWNDTYHIDELETILKKQAQSNNSELIKTLQENGYNTEKDEYSPNTTVV